MNAIELHHVTKTRKDFTIKNLNLFVPQGYITGFIGPNGSGKTTTIQMIMDILKIDEGEIRLFGTTHKDHHVKQRIGFVYDDLYMYEDFTIKKMKSFIAPFYDSWNEELFQSYLDRFQLPFYKKIKKFSKGMKMKCSLLFALAHEPELIIMDEPTSGLDPVFRRELIEHLQELMTNEKQTIFLSTHITTDLDRIADYIIFIHNGEISLQKNMEDIRRHFHVVKGKTEMIDDDTKELFIGTQITGVGFHALFEGDLSTFEGFGDEIIVEEASLEDIMFYLTRKEIVS
ncbi:ABC transporter ATP-binding protein [Oceanobacillus piezotolerans]|uniref:ABC transporter ATP-binding protein n=1 Tax=Oceanobacillus piezotolerans TaxID=2448030 RepID=A0A498DAI2_9BACI|nr:ABC transporter ATP-binding protein [Oceanobacillus piezotolerans]RLL46744.1 ABC transporter ATP-binding protein [Oceanobacillus piezotolerans]